MLFVCGCFFTIECRSQAFEEFPIRVDISSCTVDVVWREQRADILDPLRSPRKPNLTPQRSTVLRRERFQFNSIFWGTNSSIKIAAKARSRAMSALSQCTDLSFICLGCGQVADPIGEMNPPLGIVLGDRGGEGLMSAVVDEAFR